MKKLILFALMLSGLMTSAQTNITNGNCRAAFKYAINDKVMSLLPATAINFYDRSEGKVKFWFWDFGDGNTSTEQNPMFVFNHPIAGTNVKMSPYRTVSLTILTDSCKSFYSEIINIMDGSVYSQPTCSARFKYYQTAYDSIGGTASFQLTNLSEGDSLQYSWLFDNGKTSAEREPIVTFDLSRPDRKVCLTVTGTKGCTNTFCDAVYIIQPDTSYISKPGNNYTMRYEASFPPQMSSCAGWAKAQVYRNDSLVKADNYVWSTGEKGQEVKGLCPTRLYTVKAIAPDGTYVTGTFVFNSDGTVTEAPFNWWVSGYRDNPYIQYDLDNKNLSVEWRLCDGTIVKSDSIPLNSINCGGNLSNLMLKDASGNIVYSENISLKTMATGINPDQVVPTVKLYPNPVNDVLNIQYSGARLNEMQLEICDIAGRRISLQKFYEVESGQQISLNVNSLHKGIYLCKMLSGNQIVRIEKFSK